MKTKLVIVGAGGRMGKMILDLALQEGNFEIAGAIERADHPDIGKDAGLVAGAGQLNVELTEKYPSDADVAIDFSTPQTLDNTLRFCRQNNCSLVVGTTGLGSDGQAKIKEAAEEIAVIYGSNMSVGMNVLFSLVRKTAQMLDENYDIEIIEQHHKFKKDAPSGSALTLAENICVASSREYPDCIKVGRSGKNALRQKGTITIHSIRAGDITGEHSVIFAAAGETLTLGHTANSRRNFASGALKAAKWLTDKKPGLYSMADCLGIS